jgi:hypothetical protein
VVSITGYSGRSRGPLTSSGGGLRCDRYYCGYFFSIILLAARFAYYLLYGS